MSMSFERKVIDATVDRLIKGDDYRTEIVNSINVVFLDFSIAFFKDIVSAKLNSQAIDLSWYKKYFITNPNIKPEDAAIYAGMNKKTISNIHGTANKEIVLDVAENNFEYLSNMISELEKDSETDLNIEIKITYNKISVELSLSESLLVINALATKKLAIRGGAWSSIGKKVEKPLMIKLCKLCNVPITAINSDVFVKDGTLDYDREVDFKLLRTDNTWIRCEVKLMGKGNPESADAVIARDSDLFVADTLSEQNKRQLNTLGVQWLELKGHSLTEIKQRFSEIINKLNVKMN